MDNKPYKLMSVVIVILGGRSYVPRCLTALARQQNAPKLEIIVPCDQRIRDVAALQKQFPEVKFMEVPGQKTYAQLRAIGFLNTSHAVIALTEDHCSPAPDWCAQIIKEHEGAYAAVGGAVDKSNADTLLNWAIYLSDFSRYMNPVPEGHSHYLTDCNVSYKHEILDEIRHLWDKEFHETTVNWTLQDRGHKLLLSPRVIVYQQRSLKILEAFHERYAFGRLFASTRVAATTAVKRLIYALLAWLLPFIFLARVAKNVFSKKRNIGKFFQVIPLLVALNLAWAWGEFIGYLTGTASKKTIH